MSEFTKNEALSMMYESNGWSFRKTADYIEKWKLDWEESAKLLREIADEQEAQAVVVTLRDEVSKPPS